MGTSGRGVFKSTDGGVSWIPTGLTTAFVYTLAIDPQAPATLYAGATSGGVFKSTDGGGTWSAFNVGFPLPLPQVRTLAIDPQTPTSLYAGTSADVFSIQQQSIQQQANRPPVANAGPDQAVDATDSDGAAVTLDGAGSSDPDGDALTLTWSWATGTATGVRPTVRLPRGTTTVTLMVRDPQGASASDTVQVVVRDTPPPTVQTTTVDFDNPPPPGRINGVFQGLDFGTGQWQWSGAYDVNPSNHIYFADSTGTSRSFQFSPGPRVLNGMRVYATTPGTLTLSDDAGQTFTQAVTTGSLQAVATGWTRPATTVTVSFTNEWDLGVDDITYSSAP